MKNRVVTSSELKKEDYILWNEIKTILIDRVVNSPGMVKLEAAYNKYNDGDCLLEFDEDKHMWEIHGENTVVTKISAWNIADRILAQ
jgi:hypothetical protein